MPVRGSSGNRCPKFLDASRKLLKEWEVNRHSVEVGEWSGLYTGTWWLPGVEAKVLDKII